MGSKQAGELPMRTFSDLGEREILALAISNEEEDGRIYADFAEGLRAEYPDSARVFADMAAEESEHRRQLIDLYVQKFGQHIPLIRRHDIRGFIPRRAVWQIRPLGIDAVRRQAEQMEQEASRFYTQAASQASDASIRKLLGDLAEAEVAHVHAAHELTERHLTHEKRHAEDDS